jgi:hypothetical protein
MTGLQNKTFNSHSVPQLHVGILPKRKTVIQTVNMQQLDVKLSDVLMCRSDTLGEYQMDIHLLFIEMCVCSGKVLAHVVRAF